MEDLRAKATACMRGSERRAPTRTELLRIVLSLSLCCFYAHSVAEPAPGAATEQKLPGERHREPSMASRAMLEFLSEFSELDDTEFELLSIYAERDANQEPQDSTDE